MPSVSKHKLPWWRDINRTGWIAIIGAGGVVLAAVIAGIFVFSPSNGTSNNAGAHGTATVTATVTVTATPSPSIKDISSTANANNEVETDLITGGFTLAGAAVGGFLAWLATARGAARREQYDSQSARRTLLHEYEDSVLQYAQAVANEIDALSDAARINAEIKTDTITARVLVNADRVDDVQLMDLSGKLPTLAEGWRQSDSVSERSVVLGGPVKLLLNQILARLRKIYSEETTPKLPAGKQKINQS